MIAMEGGGRGLTSYMDELLPQRDSILRSLEDVARQEGVPIVGPHVGSLLRILASACHAKKALELGTAIGYSTIWLARGLGPSGRLITVEKMEEMAQRAMQNIAAAGLQNLVDVRVGEALRLLPTLGKDFDLVFNDIDKEDYPRALPLCKRALRPGGFLVTDNVLWGGRVESPEDTSPSTVAIREYNQLLAKDDEMMTVILPIRDGVSISLKKI